MPSRKAFLGVMLMLLVAMGATTVAQSAAQPKNSPANEKVTAIRAANLIDGTAGQVRHNVLILIKGNRVDSVSNGGTPPADATVIDLPASVTVLPGLIDTHT